MPPKVASVFCAVTMQPNYITIATTATIFWERRLDLSSRFAVDAMRRLSLNMETK